MNSVIGSFSRRTVPATIRSVIKFNGFNRKSSRRGKKFVRRQMRRKPQGKGDQIERITPGEREWKLRVGDRAAEKRGERGRCRGGWKRKGVLCAPLAREGLHDGGTSLS